MPDGKNEISNLKLSQITFQNAHLVAEYLMDKPEVAIAILEELKKQLSDKQRRNNDRKP